MNLEAPLPNLMNDSAPTHAEAASGSKELLAPSPAARALDSKLLSLPIELQKSIIDFLDAPKPPVVTYWQFRGPPSLVWEDAASLLNLRMTCRHFQALIPAPKHKNLLAAEKSSWAQDLEIFTCVHCVRLRPRSEFAKAMTMKRKGREGGERNKRICVDCGRRPIQNPGMAWYGPGSELEVEGKRWVVCRNCKVFTDDVKKVVGIVGKGLCSPCAEQDQEKRENPLERGGGKSYDASRDLGDGEYLF